MNIFDKISEKELDMIEYYRENYAFYGEDGDSDNFGRIGRPCSTEYFLRFWNENKQNLFHMLGDSLIYEQEVEYVKPLEEMKSDFVNIIYNNKNIYGIRKEETIANGRNFYFSLCNLLRDNYIDYSIREYLTSPLDVIKNSYEGSSETIFDDIKLQKGAKITKIYAKLAEKFNLQNFEDFRLLHSQVLNNKTIKGTLCLSIHPLDFMTMSDNNSGWESCMSWINNGCYRQGTVEMMNSEIVVVAYIKGAQSFPLSSYNDYYWSNKKWRELFIVSPEILMPIKAYPYYNENLEKSCLNILKNLAPDNYSDNMVELDCWQRKNYELQFGDKVLSLNNLLFDFTTNKMYNDIENAIDHAFAYISCDVTSNGTYTICYSGETECVWCGRESDSIECCSLLCDDCYEDNSVYCDSCGDRISEDNAYYLDGIPFCEYCYNDHAVECVNDGDYHYDNNCFNLAVLRQEGGAYTYKTILNNYDDNVAKVFLGTNNYEVERNIKKDLISQFGEIYGIVPSWSISNMPMPWITNNIFISEDNLELAKFLEDNDLYIEDYERTIRNGYSEYMKSFRKE